MGRIVAGQPDDALRVGLLRSLVNNHPAPLNRLATIGNIFLRSQLALTRKRLTHELMVQFLLTGKPFSAGGRALRLPHPVDHEPVNPGSSNGITDRRREVGQIRVSKRDMTATR